MAASVAPDLQLHLVAAQASGHGVRGALDAALDACGIAAAGTTAALRCLLLERSNAAAVLAAAANASGHPCARGILLARLLSGSLVSAGELLAAADPADLALAVGELHAASRSSALPAPAAAVAKQAFFALIKMLATSGDGAEQRSATEHVMAHLRRAWLAPAAAAGISSRSFNGDGALLLAAAVDAVDAEVFPRQLAHSWLVAELGHVLRSPAAEGHQPPQQQAGAAGSEAGPGGSWAAAMAAFAAALPAEALLKLAQAAAGEGRLHPQRTAALLAAAAQQHQGARPLVEQWVAQQATQALARPAAPALRALILLQRELLLWSGGAAAAPAASTAQQAQQAQQQQQSAQQAYKQWFAATLLAPAQHPHLQFLVQQVLIPLVPEEGSGCAWLQAQADVLAGLLRLAQQPGAAPLPQAASRAAEEYLEAAKQRLKAEQAAAAAAGGDQVGAGGPAAPLTNMQKGQALVAAMLRDFEDNGGELRSGTLNQMQAKASNVFTRGEIHNMLLPALLAPTDDELEAQRRAGLVQYLYQELGRRGDSQIRPHLKPEVLALFHRRCLQAQLEGASLLQLAERAPQLLMAGGSAAEDPAGSSGGSGSGGISSHQVIDKLGRLVGEDLQRWHSQQEQRRPGSGSRHASGGASVGSPDELAAVLLDIWMAAFCSRSGSGSADGGSSGNSGPSPAAVAAHLLSIAHAHPQLHAPLLHRLQQRLLGSGPEQPAAAQHTQQLEAAAMLATVAGALVQQRGSGSSGGTHAAAAGPGALQPLFVWQQEPFEAAAAAAAEAEPPAAATVPGPLWLQQQLLALPLSDAAAMARSAGVAAAHLSCLRHFAQHCLLPGVGDGSSSSSSSSSGGSATALALRWQHGAAASAGSYDGEFVAGLVLPACAAAVRLLQWLLLRLSVGSQLLPCSQGQGSSNSGGRAAKRPRNAAGAAAEAAADCDGVMEACSRALRSEKGASLAMSAGGLPLADYLRLEASAGSSSSTDLLPAGAAEAALRLCCALYLQPGGSSGELASLVQPLTGAPAGGGGGRPAGAYVDEGDVLTIPDSEEEDELPAAGAATSSSSSLVEALGAATAAVLAGAAQQQAASAAAAALSVCQRACGHSLRLLAAAPGSDGLPSLLVQLLASAAQHSRQQLAVRAVAPAGQQPGSGQWQQGQQAAVQLRLTDPQQAGRVQQAVAALSSGLTLELLPLPLAGSATLEGQQRRLAAVAGVVQRALSDAGLSAPPAEVQRQLVAALESA